MASLLLVYDFWKDYLLTPPRIAGLSLIIIGVAVAFLAKRLTRVIKKQSVLEKGDKMVASILTFSLVIILGGMICAIL